MCSTVLFSLTESRTSFHAPPCSLKTSFCGSVNRIAVSCQRMFIVLSCSIVVCCVRITAAGARLCDWGQVIFGGGLFSWLAIESVLPRAHADRSGTRRRASPDALGIQLA